MGKLIVIFPGWGSFLDLYLDIEEDIEKIYLETLDIKELERKLKGKEKKELIFLAWSMGNLHCLKNYREFNVKKMILISPTLNFTKTMNKVIVKKMIKKLERNTLKTLLDFLKLNFLDLEKYGKYIEKYHKEIESLKKEELKEGLEFLLNENLEDIKEDEELTPLLLISKNDSIIAMENSKDVIKKFPKAEFHLFEKCGHNIIFEEKIKLQELVRGYINDREKTSK